MQTGGDPDTRGLKRKVTEDDADGSNKRHKHAPRIEGPIKLFLEEGMSADTWSRVRRVVYFPEQPRMALSWLERFQKWAAPEFWDVPEAAALCHWSPNRVEFNASSMTEAAIVAYEHLLKDGLGDDLPCLLPAGIQRLVVDYLKVEIRAHVRIRITGTTVSSPVDKMTDCTGCCSDPLIGALDSICTFSVWRGKLDPKIKEILRGPETYLEGQCAFCM